MPLAACHGKGILPSHAAAQKLAPSSCPHLAGGGGKAVRNGSSLRLLCQRVSREVAGGSRNSLEGTKASLPVSKTTPGALPVGATSSPLSASALSQHFTDVKSLVPERKVILLAPCLSSKSFFLSPLRTVAGQGFLLPLLPLIFICWRRVETASADLWLWQNKSWHFFGAPEVKATRAMFLFCPLLEL